MAGAAGADACGRAVQGCAIGLANWLALHDRAAAEIAGLAAAAAAAMARRDELRARFGLLRAKHRAHPSVRADAPAEAARAALDRQPLDLDAVAAALGAFQSALAAP